MKPWLISVVLSPPPGFQFEAAPKKQQFARQSFCLFVPGPRMGEEILGSLVDRALGLVAFVGDSFEVQPLGPFCRKISIPLLLLPWLAELARDQISMLEAMREQGDIILSQKHEIERHQRDRAALAQEHLEFRNSLLRENADRRRAEEEIAAANELYRSIFRAAVSHAIIGTKPEGLITVFSEGAELLLGYTADEAVGKMTPLDYHDPAEVAARAAEIGVEPDFGVFTVFPRRGEVEIREWTYIRKDGTRLTVLLSVSAQRDREGRIVGFLGVASDITERKRAREEVLRLNRELEDRVQERTAALTSSNAIIRATLESTTEGIIATDLEGRITMFNERFLEICPVPAGKEITTLRQLADEVFIPHLSNPEEFLRREQTLEMRPEEETFDILEFKNGRVLERCSRQQRIGNRSFGRVWSYRDITERRAMESQLQQSQKLEAVGQLAAGIAHELNTPAQYVGDNIRFIQESFKDIVAVLLEYQNILALAEKEKIFESAVVGVRQAEQSCDLQFLQREVPLALKQAGEGIERMAAIVLALKEFAHPDSVQPELADLNHALENTLMIARNEYKYVADVETELNPLPLVSCHIGQLNQVFVNLIVNAAHAIADQVREKGGRGRIRVRTLQEGGLVKVQIEDTGGGIPEGIRDRIFDPFFTTKEVGRGSGQGLAIAHSIVVGKHGGALTFETEVGKGTTFTVALPVREPRDETKKND